MRSTSGFAAALALAAGAWGAGCGGIADRRGPVRALPFIVRLREVALKESEDRPRRNAASVPAAFGDGPALTRELAERLDRAGIFEMVVAEGADSDADLEMSVTIKGDEFGPGEPKPGGAFFSTIAWLLAGHLSWFIKDREYPNSQVRMEVVIREPRSGREGRAGEADEGRADLFADVLSLKELDLSFAERAGGRNWFYNIIVPPWWGDGDPETAGASLARNSLDLFVAQESDRITTRLPALYFNTRLCFLARDREEGAVLVASKQPIVRMEIEEPGGQVRVLDRDRLQSHLRDRNQVRFSDLVEGFVDDPTYSYYRIPIAASREGWVRIQANLEEGGGNLWSVYQDAAALARTGQPARAPEVTPGG